MGWEGRTWTMVRWWCTLNRAEADFELALKMLSRTAKHALKHSTRIRTRAVVVPRLQSTLAQTEPADPGPSLFRRRDSLNRPLATILLGQSAKLSRLNSRLDGAADDGQIARALQLCAQIRDEGHPPNRTTYNALIRALSTSCYFDEALAFFEEMKLLGVEPNNQTFSHLLHVRIFSLSSTSFISCVP